MEKNITIQTQNLTKTFGSFTAVNGINFAVQQGEIFGFLGPNGSGKTTTIRMMLGLLTPTQGSIQVLGVPVPEHIQGILPRIGYMSQQFSLYNDLTVRQNLEFYGQAYGLESEVIESRIQGAVQLSGLTGYEDTTTSQLAGGWRQRLALSAAIIHQPEVIFLDEPTAGVDPVSRREFWDLLYLLVSEGITVFITTHYMDEAEHCHRVAFLQHGNIIAQGSPARIKDEYLSGTILELEASNPEEILQAISNQIEQGRLSGLTAELYGSLVHLTTSHPTRHRRIIKSLARKSNILIHNLIEIEPSLEDVFIACMQDRNTGGNHED